MNQCLVDTCVNLTDESFVGNEDKIIDNAKRNNVEKLVLIGNNLESSRSSLKLAQNIILFQVWAITRIMQKSG